MLYRSAFRKSLLFSALSLLLSTPTAWSDVAPITVSSVQSSANTGAATTSIPIDVPPGRKGIQPNLALTYNSNSPNGWLGVGLGLDMGAIQRSTKRGVSYSANDYVFTSGGGSSELVARGDWGTGYYGAKSEGAFSKYYFDSSTGGWVVTTKDGTKYYYGTTAASRQDSALGVFKWYLDKVQDTNGNYMTVIYSPLDNGERYIDEIKYTGNTNGLSPANSVKFYLEGGRTDAPPMYISNFEIRTRYRLKTIEVYGNGQLARKYVLNYKYGGGTSRTLLTSVTPYGSDGTTALSTITVTWQEGPESGTFPNAYEWAAGPSYGTGYQVQYADLNGDGKDDIYLFNSSNGSHAVWLNNGNGTFPTSYTWTSSTGYGTSYQAQLGDFNGDGKADIYLFNSGNGTHAVWLNSGGGTFPANYTWTSSTGYGTSYQAQLGDFNGDGKADIYLFNSGNGTHAVWLNSGNGAFPTNFTWTSSTGYGTSYQAQLGDFNGDGKADIYLFNSGNGTHALWLNNGSGSFPTNYTWTSSTGYGTGYEVHLGDFNGDGKTDIHLSASSNGWHMVWLNNGSGSFPSAYKWTAGPGYGTGYQARLSDFNGDGKADIAMFASSNGWHMTWLNQGLFPDHLSTLSNGFGATTTITYTPSTSYSNGLLPFVVQTVSSITVDDGNGNTSTTNYTYSGGLYDATEKEFRGFSYVKSTDPSSHTTETWFKQDSVFKGLPYDQIFKDSSGNTYTRTVNTYQSTTPYTGVTFPYLYQRDDYIHDTYTTPKRVYSVFTYDGYGNVTRKNNYGDAAVTGDERDEYTEYSYDTTNWIVALPNHTYVLDGSGVKKAESWFTYDTKGNLLTQTAWLNGGTNPIITYTYDAYGNQATVKDARNYTSTIAYDTIAQTFPVTVTNALGHAATKTWDYRFGKPLTETDANGNAGSYTYDVFGRVVTAIGPLDTGSTYGAVTYYYQNFGTVGSQRVTAYRTEQNGTSNVIWEETYFDGLGRTIKSRREGPDNKVIVTDLKYNRRGLMTQRSLPYFEGQTVYKVYLDYDPLGRLVKTTNPDGTITTQSYNRGRVSFRDANDYKKVEEKDAYGRLAKVEEYKYAGDAAMLWTTTTYQYDTMGNLLTTIDVKGNRTVMTYDTLGRKITMNDPDMGAWSYGYDANGNLITQTDAKGQTITFTYDALNRVTKKDYPTGTDAVYTYDETTSTNGKGRLTTLVDASGTTKYWFDAMGRTTKSTRTIDGTAYTTETTYDALSRITSVKYPDNETVSYAYDAGGNLSQITGYGAYANYNALGQAGTITYPNGVTTTYQYLATNSRLYSITTATATQGLMNTSYSYDNVGNILGITDYLDANRNQTFTYDHLNRLTQAVSTAYGTLTYEYSKIGNMTSKEGISYTYPTSGNPRPHAVTATSDGKTYVYDNNGNMTSDGTRTIAYDYDNMPSSVTMGAVTTSFVYDASGQRVKKITPTTTTVYVGKVYECTNGSCTKYIMANGNKVAWKNSAGTFYYHQDHLGSSRVITDGAATKAEEITYLPYGATLTDSGNGTVSVEHRFTSQEYDAETGLYYYNARYYNPGLGRFISADSIVPDPRDPQAFNRYSYVGNNPIVYIDPTGRSRFSRAFSKFMDNQLGIERATVGLYAGVGGEVSVDFRYGHTKVGGAVGVGVAVKVGVSTPSGDIFVSHGVAATVGYDPYYGPYTSVWGGCAFCGGASGSATYYFKSGTYQLGAGYGFDDFGVSMGYSNVGGTTVGVGYGGVGGNYGLQTHKLRYSIDPTGSAIAGKDKTADPNVQRIGADLSGVTYREGGLFIGILQLFGFEGITLGNTIIGRYGRALAPKFDGFMSHELVHVGQWRANGYVSFATKYIADYARNGYWRNQFEAEARERSGYPVPY